MKSRGDVVVVVRQDSEWSIGAVEGRSIGVCRFYGVTIYVTGSVLLLGIGMMSVMVLVVGDVGRDDGVNDMCDGCRW